MKVETLPSEAQVHNARKGPSWSLGNKFLYDLCGTHPSQSDPEAVVSKFWLIGRAYSATVERRRTSEEEPLKPGENFYDNRLVPVYTQAGLDEVMTPLNALDSATRENAAVIADAHDKFSRVLKLVNGHMNLSLASKYLHFHRPMLFFIYDSFADESMRKYVPKWRHKLLQSSPFDDYYLKFCLASIALRDAINAEYHVQLTPRELDNLLLAPAV